MAPLEISQDASWLNRKNNEEEKEKEEEEKEEEEEEEEEEDCIIYLVDRSGYSSL